MAAQQTSEWKPVKVSEIHEGLTTLWREAGGESATRVCTTNLVIFPDDKSRLDEAIEASRVASEEHPLRATIVLTEPGTEEAETQGRVSGYCRLSDSGDIHICCEQIVLTAKGKAIEHLPASVAGLFVPDLPVILWWMGKPPFGDETMERLLTIADRLIVDSREFSDLGAWASVADKHPEIGLGDLNWIRLTQWRELTAEIFDDIRFLPYLRQIGSLDVSYVTDGQCNASQAALFAGWFRSRTSQTSPTGLTSISMEGIEGIPTEHCNLAAVNMESADKKAFFSLGVNAKSEIEVIAEIEGEPALYRTSAIESLPLGRLLAAEIEQGPDALYREALVAASSMPGGSQ